MKMRDYSDLVTSKKWPALATKIPAANIGTVEDDGHRRSRNDMKCHDCDSEYHFRNHPDCPKSSRSTDKDKKLTQIPTGAKGYGDWKFIALSDDNAIVTMNDLEYFFYKHCVYKRTRRQVFLIVHKHQTTTSFQSLKTMTVIPYQQWCPLLHPRHLPFQL